MPPSTAGCVRATVPGTRPPVRWSPVRPSARSRRPTCKALEHLERLEDHQPGDREQDRRAEHGVPQRDGRREDLLELLVPPTRDTGGAHLDGLLQPFVVRPRDRRHLAHHEHQEADRDPEPPVVPEVALDPGHHTERDQPRKRHVHADQPRPRQLEHRRDPDPVALLADPERRHHRDAVERHERDHARDVQELPPYERRRSQHQELIVLSASRRRRATTARILAATFGSCLITRSNELLNSRIATTGVSATTVALLGPPSSSEISPKNSPG